MIAEAMQQNYLDEIDRQIADEDRQLDELTQRAAVVDVVLDSIAALQDDIAMRWHLYVNASYTFHACTPWRPTFAAMAEDIDQLIAHFTTFDKETAMNLYSSEIFRNLTAEMIGDGNTVTLTIARVVEEKMQAGKKTITKPVMSFRERDKVLVLNKTNAVALIAVLGPETDHWTGARVTLCTETVEAFGKTVLAIRIADVVKPAAAPRTVMPRPAQPAPVVAPVPVDVDEMALAF